MTAHLSYFSTKRSWEKQVEVNYSTRHPCKPIRRLVTYFKWNHNLFIRKPTYLLWLVVNMQILYQWIFNHPYCFLVLVKTTVDTRYDDFIESNLYVANHIMQWRYLSVIYEISARKTRFHTARFHYFPVDDYCFKLDFWGRKVI